MLYWQFQKAIGKNEVEFVGMFDIKYNLDLSSSLDSLVKRETVIDDWDALKCLVGKLDENSYILDIGANVGFVTLLLKKKICPSSTIVAFEPDKENYQKLVGNIALNDLDSIIPLPFAVQESDLHSASFNIRRAIDGDGCKNYGLSSIEKINLFTKKKTLVSLVTVDEIVKKFSVQKLSFIKIDVEGAEWRVLSGGEETIKKFKPVIYYEYSETLDALTEFNNTQKCFEFFKRNGYRQFYFESDGFVELRSSKERIGDKNILCLPDNNVFISYKK